jgi:hypothetical protein
MPLPTPRSNETQVQFVQRCMADDTSRADFPEVNQRYAVCLSQWREGRSDASSVVTGSGDALPKD